MGAGVGSRVGLFVGTRVGWLLGDAVGKRVGSRVGEGVGTGVKHTSLLSRLMHLSLGLHQYSCLLTEQPFSFVGCAVGASDG